MEIQKYINTVRAKYATGVATEHSYRPALELLLTSAANGVEAINEPRRVACGAPDFVITRKGIDIGHCEAKDLHIDLAKMKDANLDQKRRYLKALPNLIYTNGIDFEFYRSGEKVRAISVGVVSGGKIDVLTDNFAALEHQLKTFASERPQSITSAKRLAEMMAGKAVLIKDIMANALRADAKSKTELTEQYDAFKTHLIHDIGPDEFADIYAETIAYGLFAARLHDKTIDTFTRFEALQLLPKSNPFLRSLFGYIAGVDLDDRIAWVIDELCDLLRACNVHELMKDFGKWTARNDPFLHFYETFLAEYNPTKRKARGVWYTPEPVVNFIVRSVDDVLKREFGLPDGLADTSKISVDWDTGQTDKKGRRTTIKKQVHRVQILDPATGTGTFLAEAIKQIAARVKGVAEGMWSTYVEQELIPRVHGFELLMASYAMCHMKLDMMLTDLGYQPSGLPPRLSVYLTNSLEEGEPADQQLPFARWLSEEAKGANTIKRDTPIMCIIGNPPYNARSINVGEWITDKIEDYKYVEGQHFGEGKHWLHDDYVKFIRLAEDMIDRNGDGVLGFITNHGYVDNPTFRGMRHHLLQTFNKIYVLDLHGNSNKKEASPDGSADKNVFDIQQGVSIIIAIKKAGAKAERVRGKKSERTLSSVKRGDIWGSREDKNDALWSMSLQSNHFQPVDLRAPYFMFGNSDEGLTANYEQGFSIDKLFRVSCTGIITARDDLAIDFTADGERRKIEAFRDPHATDATVRSLFFPGKSDGKYKAGDTRGWRLSEARLKLAGKHIDDDLLPITYRPFDRRTIYYSQNVVDWGREGVMRHIARAPNVALLSPRMTADVYSPLVADAVISNKAASRYDQTYFYPLYVYPDEGGLGTEREVNFDRKTFKTIRAAAKLDDPTVRGLIAQNNGRKPDEMLVFDYIYGVLHSPEYRNLYAQFLKIDFPRIPFPPSPKVFSHVAEKGGQLRRLHLMEDDAIGDAPYPFKGAGDGEVGKAQYKDGKVFINADQWFENVPPVAWLFSIGGYLPAQKWLKDRKLRKLSFDEVRHYQKIIKVLLETDRIMSEIKLPLS